MVILLPLYLLIIDSVLISGTYYHSCSNFYDSMLKINFHPFCRMLDVISFEV